MDRENAGDAETEAAGVPESPPVIRYGPTVVLMPIEDEEEGRLWDEIAGLTGYGE